MENKTAAALAERQIAALWGEELNLTPHHEEAVARVEYAMERLAVKKYTQREGVTRFNPLNTVQNAVYLYQLAHLNHIRQGDQKTATLLYYLNKVLHNNDWYYEIELPRLFWAEHPLGSVLGRAKYAEGFFFMQNCTVGGDKGTYPLLGKNVIMYSNSSILGDSIIGNNVILGTGAMIANENIPDNCLVFNRSPNLLIKRKTEAEMSPYIEKIFANNKK